MWMPRGLTGKQLPGDLDLYEQVGHFGDMRHARTNKGTPPNPPVSGKQPVPEGIRRPTQSAISVADLSDATMAKLRKVAETPYDE